MVIKTNKINSLMTHNDHSDNTNKINIKNDHKSVVTKP